MSKQLPWTIRVGSSPLGETGDRQTYLDICARDGGIVMTFYDPDEIDAERAQLIVCAVNCHDELLALLLELIDIEGPQPGTADWADRARAAIARAAP